MLWHRPVSIFWLPVLVVVWLVLSVILTVILTVTASAQSAITIAPSVGYEFGTPLLLRRDSGKVNQLGVNGDGTSQTHTIWIGAQLHHDSLLGKGWRWSVGGAVAPSVASFTSNPFTVTLIDSSTASVIPTARQFTVHGTSALAQISTNASVPIGGRGWLSLGLWGTWRFAEDVAIAQELLSPDSITFPGGQRTRAIPLPPDAIAPPLHAGIDAAIEFGVPVGFGLLAFPRFGVRCNVTSIADGLGLRAFSSLVGVSVAVVPDPPQLRLPPTPTIPPPAAPAPIKASIDLYTTTGGQQQVAQIIPYRVHYRNVLTLLPAIFFGHGDVRLPARYHQMSPAETAAFGNATLAGLDSLHVYHHLLNIIGQRMRQQKSSTLRLIGHTASGEPAELADERAKQVQHYLTSVWGVARRRVVVAERDPQRQPMPEFSGVIVETEDSALAAPIFWEWIVRRMAAPGIGIEHTIQADAGVQDWSITIQQQDRQLLYRSLGADSLSASANSASASKLLTLQNLREREATAPLVATLRVIDSLGAEAIAADTLRVEVLAEQDTNQITRVITTGTMFPASYFPLLAAGNEQTLRYVLGDVLPGNRVIVDQREIAVGNQVAKAITTAVGKSLQAGQAPSEGNKQLTEEWFFSKSIGLRVEQ